MSIYRHPEWRGFDDEQIPVKWWEDDGTLDRYKEYVLSKIEKRYHPMIDIYEEIVSSWQSDICPDYLVDVLIAEIHSTLGAMP